MGISFSEPERLTLIFDAEHREEWQRSSKILERLDLSPTSKIADVGAGTGYFSNLFAQVVQAGQVHAIDCEPNMVAFMQTRFDTKAFPQVSIHQSLPADPCLPQGLDKVFIANTYRFIIERDQFLRNLHQQISSETRVMFVDLKTDAARVSPQTVIQEVEAAGFEVELYDTDSCPDHYILVFKQQ
ncbi:class I SAM-dependent methyltransferase [Thaumasiovibrio subtropicus]|uniref:class I SAM-dependent methyltransferase n=1 Tax=Thaumasiovibrio subtropicus TaxID=1891207 RepID=UPI000B360702|nr:class I SAM-dependent methyltransferase [Thaumasiovibrio subtropicus]